MFGEQERNRQIRTLLQQPLLRDRAELVCQLKWGLAVSIDDLWWHSSAVHHLHEDVERLEYSQLEVEEGQLNCGIPKDEVVSFLDGLISTANLSTLKVNGNSMEISSDHQDQSTSPSMPARGVTNDLGWLRAVQERLKDVPPLPFENTECCAAYDLQGESRTLCSKEVVHRPKRPISDQSAQHPDADLRAGTNPFLLRPVSSYCDDLDPGTATSTVHNQYNVNDTQLTARTAPSRLPSVDLDAEVFGPVISEIDAMLKQFPHVPGSSHPGLDKTSAHGVAAGTGLDVSTAQHQTVGATVDMLRLSQAWPAIDDELPDFSADDCRYFLNLKVFGGVAD